MLVIDQGQVVEQYDFGFYYVRGGIVYEYVMEDFVLFVYVGGQYEQYYGQCSE